MHAQYICVHTVCISVNMSAQCVDTCEYKGVCSGICVHDMRAQCTACSPAGLAACPPSWTG